MPPVTLPDRPDALRAVDEGRANPVEVFVANFEYTGSDPTLRAAWCSQLLDALESVRGAGYCVIDEIAAERARQVAVEGWTPEHDDAHTEGQLARAAAGYAATAGGRLDFVFTGDRQSMVPRGWPWDGSWWKPDGDRRNLIKAAALIVAEIERLDRASTPASNGEVA